MQYVEAPGLYVRSQHPTIFFAGGITNCPNWQQELLMMFKDQNVTIFNPRRSNFPIDDPDAALEQISWEFLYLHTCDLVSIWFSRGSLNPIVLFELGAALERDKHLQKLVIGIDPKYERKQDVEIQVKLHRPEIDIVYSLEFLYSKICAKLAI